MMNQNITFNYIITIHNKEDLIRDVLLGVINSAGKNSYIYPVLDGCTDLSAYIIDDIIKSYPDVNIIKRFANDVHELKSINIGLQHANQAGEGFNIVLQDDVVLNDHDLEAHCIQLYHAFPGLGLVSFRHGANLSRELILQEYELFPYEDYIQNQCGHYPYSKPILKTGYFVCREIVIKSPICIPFHVVRTAGIPDELYAPWNDLAYCYKVLQAGYTNGVFALNFLSEVDWGTTRLKQQDHGPGQVEYKNLQLFRAQHPNISPIDAHKYNNLKYQIFDADQPASPTF